MEIRVGDAIRYKNSFGQTFESNVYSEQFIKRGNAEIRLLEVKSYPTRHFIDPNDYSVEILDKPLKEAF